MNFRQLLTVVMLSPLTALHAVEPQKVDAPSVSGIYPHLAMFNNEGECGTGAVVPWAERLWVVTYAPDSREGSSDKLYEIMPNLQQIVRPESIGGTPANRMIHRESEQLFIGPYAIDAKGNVRTIPYSQMFGRLTGNARHLTNPADKIYFATMEEGMYEVDVKTLAVNQLWADEHKTASGRAAGLPGYHGKGFYSSQGRLVYANNGEHGKKALLDPNTPSGCLAEWDGKAEKWTVVRRNQFTEVTGPGGIYGNEHPDTDPIWSIGWDHRSVILMLLDNGQWHSYRLPKASHSYDGAHGWNTEWPRIRDVGAADLLMTMHGMFWRFPKTFSAKNSAGIQPCSTYLKVIGDFCRWKDRLVFGCDDTAKSEFLNKRKAKGNLAAPGQSQSNLWFVEPDRINHLGTPLGRGAVWLDERVMAGVPSDPFLFSGFDRRGVHLVAEEPVTFTFERDAKGNGQWEKLRDVEVHGYTWIAFSPEEKGAWIRVRASRNCAKATALFDYSNVPDVGAAPALGQPTTDGLLRTCGQNQRTLGFATDAGYYVLDGELKLKRVNDSEAAKSIKENAAIPKSSLVADASSILYVDESGQRWRLPKGGIDEGRVCREVCTERDLFNAGGTFYELPANNAGGFSKIRPICTHNRRIKDYCSYRGMLVMSGISGEAPHIIHSDDGKALLWCGAVDDLWKFGKPVGAGGPWKETAVAAGEVSDPYLMNGYDKKSLILTSDKPTKIQVEVDISGNGQWRTWQTFQVEPGRATNYQFPEGFNPYWVRVTTENNCTATAEFHYE